MSESTISRHVIVRGRVQGVGFRYWVMQHAGQRGLSGWVRNRRDRAVEAVFTGPQKSVEGMVATCGQGPLSAKVEAVEAREATQSERDLGRSDEFIELPTL